MAAADHGAGGSAPRTWMMFFEDLLMPVPPYRHMLELIQGLRDGSIVLPKNGERGGEE